MNSSAKLLDDLIYCKGIDAIVETSSKILNNPVILLNFSYKVLSYSKSFPIVDTLWLENIERGYCSYEYISAVLTLEDFKYAPPEDTPFIVKCSSDDNRRMVTRILIDGKCFGYFITIESNNSFDNIEKETYKLIGKNI